MRRHGQLLRAVVLCWVVLVAGALPTAAQDIPFAFLIKYGWQSTLANPQTRFDVPLTSWAGSGSFAPIVNGQIGATAGTAYVTAWSRSVPDPFYTPIGPVGAVITLDFGAFRGHLSLFDTPAGLQTTIGIMDPPGQVDYGVSGIWVLGDGSSVVGGTANDMVVGGVVRFRAAPLTIGTLSVPLTLYFPTVPFPSDSNPFTAVIVSSEPGVVLWLHAVRACTHISPPRYPMEWVRLRHVAARREYFDGRRLLCDGLHQHRGGRPPEELHGVWCRADVGGIDRQHAELCYGAQLDDHAAQTVPGAMIGPRTSTHASRTI